MKLKPATSLLTAHVVLLLLASTRFTLISWLWGNSSWTWNYARFSFENGWGRPYVSDYTLPVVLAYLLAYAAGLIGYSLLRQPVPGKLGGVAAFLCVLGLISFLTEASHWLWSHNLSLIAICPLLSLALAVFFLVRQARPAPRPSSDDANAEA